ncbi:hypothetical protein SNEBB_003830 [Seison nebaliae]|nr:hypothetical protein SNEBB_003830 [Seison nebaliae]
MLRRIIPIGSEVLKKYSREERNLRIKLASLYRLVEMNKWTTSIYNHITVRNEKKDEFLIQPFGLLYHEITANNLLSVDIDGEVKDKGDTQLGINNAGYVLHSAIHEARPDINCIIHLHNHDIISVGNGALLPVSQEALTIGYDVKYHDYNGILIDEKEKSLLQKNIGKSSLIMFLRNHGVIICGETIEEAWLNCIQTMLACKTQTTMMATVGGDNDRIKFASYAAQQQVKMVVRMMKEQSKKKGKNIVNSNDSIGLNMGELDFEAHLRLLDDLGHETFYDYKINLPTRNVNISTG